MCGRFYLATELKRLADFFAINYLPAELPAHYNIAPGQSIAVIRNIEGLGRRLDLLQWGLVPFWAKEPEIGRRLINARAETVDNKPAFRAAYRHRRCLIPANGFYEWKQWDHGKQPFLISHISDEFIAMAGLWERWESPEDGSVLESCVILTRDAGGAVARLHDRMPVIVPPDAWQAWLDIGQGDTTSLHSALLSDEGTELKLWPVSTAVNNPRHDTAELIRPVQLNEGV